MSAAKRVDAAARQAVEELIIEHAWLIDHGEADKLPELYTVDGRILGIGDDIVGRAAIAAWSARRAAMRERTSRHVCTNIHLVAESKDRIRGTVILAVYRRDDPSPGAAVPLMIGDYEDIYERGTDGRWRFAERRLATMFGG